MSEPGKRGRPKGSKKNCGAEGGFFAGINHTAEWGRVPTFEHAPPKICGTKKGSDCLDPHPYPCGHVIRGLS